MGGTRKERQKSFGKDSGVWILERNGKVKVEVVKDAKAQVLLREVIRKVKRGIYTDRYKGYDGLVMQHFRHERIDFHCT